MGNRAQEIVNEVNDLIKEDALGLASDPRFFHEKVSTGSWILDDMLQGGYRMGRFNQFYGPEGVGKTLLVYYAIAEHQRYYEAKGEPKLSAFVDAEGSFDPEFAAALGS